MPLDKQVPAGCSLQQPTATTERDIHITLLRRKLEKCPPRDSLRLPLLQELARAIFDRYQGLYCREDLNEGISLCHGILSALPEGNLSRMEWLNLSIVLLAARYEQLKNSTDLDEAITQCRERFKIACSNGVHQGISFGNLITLLCEQSRRFRNYGALEEAMKLCAGYQKLDLQKHGQPVLASLASVLHAWAMHSGNAASLDKAITLLRETCTVNTDARTLSGYIANLANLASYLSDRHYHFQGDRNDLNEATALRYKALDATPESHSIYPTLLKNCSAGLFRRFMQDGDHTDLDHSVELLHKSLALCPKGQPAHTALLNQLATALLCQHTYFGDITSLNEAIALCHECLGSGFFKVGEREWVIPIVTLGLALQERYRLLRNCADLDEAVTLYRDGCHVVSESPLKVSSDHATLLLNYATALHQRYQDLRHSADLDEAIAQNRASLELYPKQHPYRGTCLNNLSNTIASRFKLSRDPSDLDEAIVLSQESLHLRPAGHHSHGASLLNLADRLISSSKLSGNTTDFDDAIKLLRQAAMEPSVAWKAQHKLADIMLRLPVNTPYSDPVEALHLLSQVLESPMGGAQSHLSAVLHLLNDLSAAAGWTDEVRELAIKVYAQAISLMPRAAYLGQDLKQQLRSIADAETAAIMAASNALLMKDIPTAVQLLEKGRAVFWYQAARLRTPFEDEHVTQDVRNEINHLCRVLSMDPCSVELDGKCAVERDAARRWKQSQRFEELFGQLKQQFEAEKLKNPIFPPEYSTLLQTAENGVIVIPICTVIFSGAVILHKGTSDMVHLPLATPNWLKIWNQRWQEDAIDARAYLRDNKDVVFEGSVRSARLVKFFEEEHTLLSELWSNVVQPIVDAVQGRPEVCRQLYGK